MLKWTMRKLLRASTVASPHRIARYTLRRRRLLVPAETRAVTSTGSRPLSSGRFLCGARPAFEQDRLAWTADGRVAYRFERPWPDARTELVLPPVAFLRRRPVRLRSRPTIRITRRP